MWVGGGNGRQYVQFVMDKIVKIAGKKGGGILCIVLLITKCTQAEIKGDEKLLIDLEWPNVMVTCWEFRLYAWAASMYLNTAWLLHDGRSYCSSMYGVM